MNNQNFIGFEEDVKFAVWVELGKPDDLSDVPTAEMEQAS
jgi:hypothetical protein